jgi:hypothetical protein
VPDDVKSRYFELPTLEGLAGLIERLENPARAATFRT